MPDTTEEANVQLAMSLKKARRAEKRLIADAERAERTLAKAVKRRDEAREQLESIEARTEKARQRLERRQRQVDDLTAEVIAAHERRATGPEQEASEPDDGETSADEATDHPAPTESSEPAETPKQRRSTRRPAARKTDDPPPAGA